MVQTIAWKKPTQQPDPNLIVPIPEILGLSEIKEEENSISEVEEEKKNNAEESGLPASLLSKEVIKGFIRRAKLFEPLTPVNALPPVNDEDLTRNLNTAIRRADTVKRKSGATMMGTPRGSVYEQAPAAATFEV